MASERRTFGNKHSGTAVYSLAEIGAACGVSLQSIQCIEQRALRKIRAAIEHEAAIAGVSVDCWLFGDLDHRDKQSSSILNNIVRLLES